MYSLIQWIEMAGVIFMMVEGIKVFFARKYQLKEKLDDETYALVMGVCGFILALMWTATAKADIFASMDVVLDIHYATEIGYVVGALALAFGEKAIDMFWDVKHLLPKKAKPDAPDA